MHKFGANIKWTTQERDMQDAEEPKDRSLPEQKGPHPTVVREG